MIAWVYIVTNKPHGVVYVGVTSDLKSTVHKLWARVFLIVLVSMIGNKAMTQDSLTHVHRDVRVPNIHFQLGTTKYANVYPTLINPTSEPDSVAALAYIGEKIRSASFGSLEIIPTIDSVEDTTLLMLRAEKVRRAATDLGARTDQVMTTCPSRFPPAFDEATIAAFGTEAERAALRAMNASVLVVFHTKQK